MTRHRLFLARFVLVVAIGSPIAVSSQTMAFGSGAEVRTDFMKARLNAFTVMLNVLDRLAPAG